jgi:hypothetical protein
MEHPYILQRHIAELGTARVWGRARTPNKHCATGSEVKGGETGAPVPRYLARFALSDRGAWLQHGASARAGGGARIQPADDYNVPVVYCMRRAKTRKTRIGGDSADKEAKGGFMNFTRKLFLSDNNLVYLMNGEILLTCPICNHDKFQLRLGTLGKSKLSTVTNDILFGHTSHDMLDISINTYFCDNCGYGIMVRNQKFNTTSYRTVLTSIPVE